MATEGKVQVSPQAVATVVAEAVSECYGVVGMAPLSWWESLLSALRRPPPTKGIHVSHDDGAIVVHVHVIIEYGTRIATVARNVASAVRFRLEQTLGTSALRIIIHVESVRVGPHSS